ncbi:NAD(P)H-quinone oxidoreductase [Kineosporia rhizophila]|uniref:NAD(P)H-quinone oxidoreductase n=1 Tax=Kineosporia rhizophila TaxID=84633 RepID=UPI000B25DF23|nr:NAD(P)H-quinone oxidoreductase [Kineosporia rhizophila]
MRAVTINDRALSITDLPAPEPGSAEVLVRVRACGLNGADLLQLKGRYAAPPGAPADIPGLEMAGEVVGLGPGATRFAVGDRVMGILGGGGQAELCVAHERVLMPVPEGLSWAEAGGLAEVFTTAHDALFTQGGLRAGERLLVHGAAGGVGSAAVQLGRAAGARVTATVRNPDSREQVAALGAKVVAPGGFEDHGPFDVILELVGGPNLPGNLEALDLDGRIVVIGVGAGRTSELDLQQVMQKRARIFGSTLRARPLEQKAATARAVERSVLPFIADGTVTVPVAATFSLEQAQAAYDRFSAGGKHGKIVLVLSEEA